MLAGSSNSTEKTGQTQTFPILAGAYTLPFFTSPHYYLLSPPDQHLGTERHC